MRERREVSYVVAPPKSVVLSWALKQSKDSDSISNDKISNNLANAAARLAQLRTKQHPGNSVFTDSCYEAFQALLRRVGSGSLALNCRSIAMVVWSVARVAKAEGWRLPRRRSAAASAAASATPAAGVA